MWNDRLAFNVLETELLLFGTLHHHIYFNEIISVEFDNALVLPVHWIIAIVCTVV